MNGWLGGHSVKEGRQNPKERKGEDFSRWWTEGGREAWGLGQRKAAGAGNASHCNDDVFWEKSQPTQLPLVFEYSSPLITTFWLRPGLGDWGPDRLASCMFTLPRTISYPQRQIYHNCSQDGKSGFRDTNSIFSHNYVRTLALGSHSSDQKIQAQQKGGCFPKFLCLHSRLHDGSPYFACKAHSSPSTRDRERGRKEITGAHPKSWSIDLKKNL